MGKRRWLVKTVRKRARQSLLAEPLEPYENDSIRHVFSESTVRSGCARH